MGFWAPITNNDRFTVNEGSILSGNLLSNDIDYDQDPIFVGLFNGSSLNYGTIGQYTTSYGTATIYNTGQFYFSATGSSANSLRAGQTVDLTFSYWAHDGVSWASSPSIITLTIVGRNDVASISGTRTGTVIEDEDPFTSGRLTVSDPDSGEAVLIASTGNGSYGRFTVQSGGNWNYNLDEDNATVQALGVGETLVDRYTVRSLDGTAQRTIEVEILGRNDAPVAVDDTFSVDEEATLNANLFADNGGGSDTDIDGDTLVLSHFNGVAVNGATTVTTDRGTWTVHANGDVLFDPNDSPADGAVATETITYQVADGYGGTATAIASVAIAGAADGASFSGDHVLTVTEGGDTDVDPGTSTFASGRLVVSDPDDGEALLIASTGDGSYGRFTVQSGGNWSYQLDNDNAAVQALGEGESLVDFYTVRSIDGSEHVVYVDIRDGLSGIIGTTSGTVWENGDTDGDAATSHVVSGSLTVDDPDDGQSAAFEAFTRRGDLDRGTFQLFEDGTWVYTLDNTEGSVDALSPGETSADLITVRSQDGSHERQLRVDIFGYDDPTVVVGDTVVEISTTEAPDGGVEYHGRLIDDPDDGLDVVVGERGTGGYGQFFAAGGEFWYYELNNTDPDVAGLQSGETLTDSYTFFVDGQPFDVTVVIRPEEDLIF